MHACVCVFDYLLGCVIACCSVILNTLTHGIYSSAQRRLRPQFHRSRYVGQIDDGDSADMSRGSLLLPLLLLVAATAVVRAADAGGVYLFADNFVWMCGFSRCV